MKIAVVGATGMVGGKMLKVMEEQHVLPDVLIPAASERSVGKQVMFNGSPVEVVGVGQAIEMCPDVAIFSAGAEASLKYAKQFASKGCYVIDNSSAWRMDKDVPLVVPEINADTISPETHIIANPNCSTIGMVMAVAPLHRMYGVRRLVISTYQSVTGSGMRGLNQLEREEKGEKADNPAYPHPIFRNIIPHGGSFCEDGYTTEEQKLVNETRKILNAPQIAVSATVARVPVIGGHSESVNIEFEKSYDIKDVVSILEHTEGIVVQDNPAENLYPMPISAHDRDEVFVGRIRRDTSIANGLNIWLVSDNLRKGAATNAVQIAKVVINNILKHPIR